MSQKLRVTNIESVRVFLYLAFVVCLYSSYICVQGLAHRTYVHPYYKTAWEGLGYTIAIIIDITPERMFVFLSESCMRVELSEKKKTSALNTMSGFIAFEQQVLTLYGVGFKRRMWSHRKVPSSLEHKSFRCKMQNN